MLTPTAWAPPRAKLVKDTPTIDALALSEHDHDGDKVSSLPQRSHPGGSGMALLKPTAPTLHMPILHGMRTP